MVFQCFYRGSGGALPNTPVNIIEREIKTKNEFMALVLTRKEGESLMIGEDIEVNVITSRNGQVKLAVTAPKSVEVHREEIYEKIKASKVAGLTAE